MTCRASNARRMVKEHDNPTESRLTAPTDDIHLTHQIIAVAKPLKVAVHDQLIIGKHGHVSLKGFRLFQPAAEPTASHISKFGAQ
jgi:DNA repair protein RadC